MSCDRAVLCIETVHIREGWSGLEKRPTADKEQISRVDPAVHSSRSEGVG